MSPTIIFQKMTSDPLPLNTGCIHIWRAAIYPESSRFIELKKILSDDEIKRANRFRFEKDRIKYITARGTLRSIISIYSSLPPESLKFDYGTYGKPYLKDETNPLRLSFNVSHAEDIALYAFSQNNELGIDLEELKSFDENIDICHTLMTEHEKKIYSTLSKREKDIQFIKSWTRMEALMKAIGLGISNNKESIRLVQIDNENLVAVYNPSIKETHKWFLKEIYEDQRFVAVLASRDINSIINYYDWT